MTDLPTTGGSYVRDLAGRLVRQSDEDAPAPRPSGPAREPAPSTAKTKGGQ